MKKIKYLLIITLLICAIFYLYSQKNSTKSAKKVFINKIVDHYALDQTVQGIIDALKEDNIFDSIEFKVESSQGNASLVSQINNKFIAQKADIIVAVGTLPAQNAAKYALENKTKLLFSSVTDPVGADLTYENALKNNITGVSNFVPLEPQLDIFRQILPDIKNLGIIFNAGESNSVSIVNKLEKSCPNFGIKLIKQSITNSSQAHQAAIKLSSLVDAIFISNDNTALSSLQTIIKAAKEANIPVFVSDTDAVKLGALAALGPNQYQVGYQTGKIVSLVLSGKNMSDMPIEFPKNTELFLNIDTAKELKLNFTDTLLKQANTIIGDK